MDTRHGAIIRINKAMLATMLDMKGAVIHRVYQPEGYFDIDHPCFCVSVEHPDLPEVGIGEQLPEVAVVLMGHYAEDGKLLGIERLSPPKKEEGTCTK